MKLAWCVLTPDVANPDALGYRAPFPAALVRLAELGYTGVELMSRDAGAFDAPAAVRLIREAGLEVAQVCTGEVYGSDRLSLADPDPAVRAAALRRLKGLVDLAAEFGAPVNLGRARGAYRREVPRAQTESWAEEGCRALARYAQPLGVTICLEPVTHLQTNFITDTAEGVAWVRRVDEPNFRLMLDLFHANLEDAAPLPETIRRAATYLAHIHVADSNRRPPGRGRLDFAAIIAALTESGYEGYLSGEMLCLPDQETALKETMAALGPLIRPGRA